MGDLLGGQSADLAKRQRHLQLWVNGGMTAGEYQAQSIVFDLGGGPGRIFIGHFVYSRSDFGLECLQAALAIEAH